MNSKSDKYKNSALAKCAYGMADIYGGGAFVIIGTFFTVFLTKAMGMPTALAGTIPLIGKVWDAITDPLMGNIVDRTQSKLGAKRFYILVGSIISAITFLLMWCYLGTSSMTTTYIFYAAMYMLFSTGFTIVMVPYNSLLPDMVEDYTLRARFSAIRIVFSTVGAILAGIIPTLMITDNTNPTQYFSVAIIFAVLFFVVILLCFMGTWERTKQPIKLSFKEGLTQSFTVYKCKSFRLFIGIFLCGQGAADFVTGMAVYYVDDVLNAYYGGRFTILMGVILISQFVGTLLFTVVMPRTSKKFPVLVAFPIRIIATICLLLCSKEGAADIFVAGGISLFHVMLFLSFIIGIGMAASSTSIYAILADMADVDELITSINRPGTVSAMATFVRKIVGGLSATVIGLLLAMVGYDEVLASQGMRQAASTQVGIAQIYVWAPTVLMILTLIFTIIFPVNKREFDIVRKEVARRKGEDSSTATAEEIAVCEKVTGFKFDKLWNKDNAVKF